MLIRKIFSFIKIRIIDLYILEEIASVFFGSVFFISFILLMFQAIRLAEFFVIHGASGKTLLKMTFFLAVSFLPMAFPLAFLIAVLTTFARLSMDSEIIAMKAHGMSLLRQSIPVSLFAILISTLSIFLNQDWVPLSMAAFRKTQLKLANTKVVSAVKEGTFTSGFFDLLIFTEKVDSQNNELKKVFIYDERSPHHPLTYIAKKALIQPLETNSDLSTALVLQLENGTMHHSHLMTATYEKANFERYQLYLKIEEGVDAHESAMTKPVLIPNKTLIQKINSIPEASLISRELKSEYWRRYATGFSPLIFVFMGIGLGTFQTRNAKSNAFLLGFLVVLSYWILQTYSIMICVQGHLPAYFAMQLPNLVMLSIALWSFQKASW